MRFLLALILLLITSAAAQSQDTLSQLWINQTDVSVERVEHPKAHEQPEIQLGNMPLPAYFAHKYLSDKDYAAWALFHNAYYHELARRSGRDIYSSGSTTTITNTTNGTVSTTTPRLYRRHEGTIGVMLYNPFVPPQRE